MTTRSFSFKFYTLIKLVFLFVAFCSFLITNLYTALRDRSYEDADGIPVPHNKLSGEVVSEANNVFQEMGELMKAYRGRYREFPQ